MSDVEWDNFLANHPHSHHEQSSRYGLMRTAYGFECHRALLREAGKIVGGVQVLADRTPLGRFARIFRGPLAKDDDPAIMAEVVVELEKLAEEKRFVSMRVDTFPTQETARTALAEAGFYPTIAWYREKRSCVIPLNFTEDELFKIMDGNVRYSVRFARRHGVTVQHGEPGLLSDFYNLHLQTSDRQGFPVFPREYFEYLWDLYRPAGRIRFFVARHNGRPIAAACGLIVGERLYYTWGGLHNGVEERRLLGMYTVHMEAVAWGRKQGCTHYDLSGNQKFKRQFASETISWPAPQRKFYGPLNGLRRRLFEAASGSGAARMLADKGARLLGMKSRNDLPW